MRRSLTGGRKSVSYRHAYSISRLIRNTHYGFAACRTAQRGFSGELHTGLFTQKCMVLVYVFSILSYTTRAHRNTAGGSVFTTRFHTYQVQHIERASWEAENKHGVKNHRESKRATHSVHHS